MPYPNKGESHSDYIPRCMANSEMQSKFPDVGQRYAVCESYYKEKNEAPVFATEGTGSNTYVPGMAKIKEKKKNEKKS